MNEFLADMYNTRQSIGAPGNDTEVEKLAEAQLLDDALRAEGVDIEKLPGDTILKLAHQMFGSDSALVKAASEGAAHEEAESEEKEEGEKEEEKETGEKSASEETFEEKVAQADFLGRVMAHSYWNEKTGIEKEASIRGIKDFAVSKATKAKELFGKAKETVGKGVEGVKKYHTDAAGDISRGVRGFTKRDASAGPVGLREATKVERAKEFGKGVAKFTPHAAVVTGGGAFAAHKFKKKSEGEKKTASADTLDVLAEKRAMDWAAAHGLIQTEETDEMKLAAAVDQRAAEMLREAGIDIDAVEAAAQE